MFLFHLITGEYWILSSKVALQYFFVFCIGKKKEQKVAVKMCVNLLQVLVDLLLPLTIVGA